MNAKPESLAAPDERGVVRIVNRNFSSNTYLLPLAEAGTCVVIDPGLDFELIDGTLKRLGLKPLAILSTHGHFDHVGAVEPLRRAYAVSHHLHAADLKLVERANFLMAMCRIPGRIETPKPDVAFNGEFALSLGGVDIRLSPLPGHTPGSCLISAGGVAFSGDSIYRRGLDALALPGSDNDQMRASLLGLWDVLDENIWIYPGHGGAAPFGDIKRHNLKLRAFLGLPSL